MNEADTQRAAYDRATPHERAVVLSSSVIDPEVLADAEPCVVDFVDLVDFGDFNSDDPLERYQAHQRAKGRA